MLDLDSITPTADTTQSSPPPQQETQTQETTTKHQDTPSIEDSGGDFLSTMDKVLGEAFDEKPKKEVIEEEVVETKVTEESKVQDDDGLETPEMTEAVKKMSMKSAEAFNKIKANANAKLAEYKEKLAALEAKAQSTANDARIEELNAAIAQKEAVLAETSKKLAFHEITEHPEYEAAVLKPTQIIKSKIQAIAARYELEPSQLVAAVTEKNPKTQAELLSDLASGMSDYDKTKLYQIPDDWTVIMDTEQSLRDNAVKAWEEIQTNRKKEQDESKVKMTQERKQLGEQVWAKLSEKVPVLKDLNADTLKATFDATDFDAMKPVDKVAALAAGVTFAPVIQKLMSEVKTKDTKIAELEASLKKYINTSPGAGSGVTTDTSESVDASLGFLGALEKMMQKA
jgi:dGTP triphosphohydrolase